MKNSVLLGSILCFIAAVSWGAMFPVAHDAFKHIDPFYFTIFRYGAVTVILIVLLLWKEGKSAFRLEGKGLQLWFFGTMAF
ncbi:MAG: EamA family transporter, partial [Solibacillus isronensis]